MRYVFFLLATLAFLPSAYAIEREKLMDSFFSIVIIHAYNDSGGLATGSGVVVAPNKVLTNCHIFRQTKQPWVSRGEDSYTISSVQADRWHDLCLITADLPGFAPARIGKVSDMKKGNEIVAIGHSGGSVVPLTSSGNVKSLYDMDGGKIIRSTARFALGASGSGLFDNQGRLVGINTFKTVGKEAYYYAVPVEWLSKLEKLPEEKVFPIIGKAFWEEEEATKPYYLRVAVPEIQEDWPKLAEVAKGWTLAEPTNTDAWYEVGLANEKMGRQLEAENAYRQSVALNAANTDSLFRIGIIASVKGDKKEVHAINLALLDIDKDIAAEFSKAAGCTDQC
jgi:serine protease Do